LLHGNKAFVVNGGRADLTVVFAQVDAGRGWDGIGAFVLACPDGRAPDGLRAGERHRLLGLETVHAAELHLDGVFVPDDDRLRPRDNISAALGRLFARAALVNAARQVGLARAAYEYALGYTQERHAFGKPVAHFQAIAFTLADMHMDVESARWMVWRAAAAVDKAGDGGHAAAARLVAEAAVHANEAAWRVADNGVQLLGGAGYIQDFPVEKWLRDTKALSLFAPTDQLQQLAAASESLGHPLEAAWPSSAIQPIFT
jgi:acyl-CoA dehydrogenase